MGLNNTQYDTLMRQYSLRQLENQHRQEEHRRIAYEAIPQLAELDRQTASLSLAKARAMLLDTPQAADSDLAASVPVSSDLAASGSLTSASASSDLTASILSDTSSGTSLREQLQQCGKRRTELLKEHGFPADYLELHYTCPDCQDSGYQNGQKCHCYRQAAIDLLYTQSGLQEILRSENFQHFSLDYYPADLVNPDTGISAREMITHTVTACHHFVDHFDTEFSNLFFYGGTGLGKTFLSHCIAKELIERAHSVIYYSSFELFDLFAQSSFGRRPDSDLKEYVFDCDLLIIDDLGTELTNSFVSSQLFLILNERIQRQKSTIISTNLPLAVFAETYSERVFSRITSNFELYHLFGNDIRLQKKLQR